MIKIISMSEKKEASQDQLTELVVDSPRKALKAMYEMCLKIDFTTINNVSTPLRPTLEHAEAFSVELKRLHDLIISGLEKETSKIENAVVISDSQSN